MENYLGEIKIFPYTYMPMDWLPCNGGTYSVQQYQALFAIIGTRFGGDGKNTFGVPDLRGTVLMGSTAIDAPGQKGGTETQGLTYNNLANHSHSMNVTIFSHNNQVSLASYKPDPTIPLTNTFIYNNSNTSTSLISFSTSTDQTTLNPLTIGAAGGALPHENRMPVLALNIGIYASGGSWPYNN